MKKILIIITIFFSTISTINAEEVKRIVVGSKDAKITIIAFESLTCSHCANSVSYTHLTLPTSPDF